MSRDFRHDHSLTYEAALPADLGVTLTDRCGGYVFRAAHVRESLIRQCVGDPYVYRVRVWGPRLTGKGTDHATASADITYANDRFAEAPLTDLPDAVTDYLLGEDALRRAMGIGR